MHKHLAHLRKPSCTDVITGKDTTTTQQLIIIVVIGIYNRDEPSNSVDRKIFAVKIRPLPTKIKHAKYFVCLPLAYIDLYPM